MIDLKCNRCGKCCHYLYDGKIYKCPYLTKCIDNKYLCRIYKTRFKKKIKGRDGKYHYCIPRIKSTYDFYDCPNNTNKEILL